jgi:signal transduction histidine kinase
MKTRAVLIYWLVLLAATLGAGAVLLRLLQREQGQLAVAQRAAAEQQARSVAEALTLMVEDAKDSLLGDLVAHPEAQQEMALAERERTHPLVRNTFIWSREKGLQWPPPAGGRTAEQDGFALRYQRLFSGAQAWPAPTATDRDTISSPRREVRALSKVTAPDSGWITWFWEDQLYLLGWVADAKRDHVYGLEMEMPALLARLVNALPTPPAGQVYALRDGNDHLFAQRGAAELATNENPVATFSLGPTLPHWTVALYGAAGSAGGRAFRLTVGAVAAVLMLAILSAGSLLLWQARRSVLEARRKTSFVSNVSHELKTPLTTIRMYAEMLAEGRVSDVEKRTHYLRVITKESQRLTRLVNNVLDFSRLEQGRKNYHRSRLNLGETLAEILEAQAGRLQEAGLDLVRTLPPGAAWVMADRDALEQAVLNLLDNAIKYAATGRRLAVSLEARESTWQVIVEDQGPGIPPTQREKIFQQFHRLDDTLTGPSAGFGLGLSIARRLVVDQGGTLVCEATSGAGARFVITLPATPEIPS